MMETSKRAKAYLYPTKEAMVEYMKELIERYEGQDLGDYGLLVGDLMHLIKTFNYNAQFTPTKDSEPRTVEEVRIYRDAYDDIVSFFRNKNPSDDEVHNIMNKHGDLLKDFIESDYSDFDWGMICGKLSTLRWLLGEDWDSLDTQIKD